VKNVTGYDLSKLMCGSWGQLAVMTEITFKVLPRPRVSMTLAHFDLKVDAAYAQMTRALRSQAEVAAAAWIPPGLIEPASMMLLRLEGFGPSVAARAQHLESVLGAPPVVLEGEPAERTWSRVCGADALHSSGGNVLWRICVPATKGAALCERLVGLAADFFVDWGGALIWARVPSSVPAESIRTLAEHADGHATLVHAPDDYRLRTAALHPESRGVAALTARVKASFDPQRILDPHRFELPA
jgi:glycolate oxidase FAD binding subunit